MKMKLHLIISAALAVLSTAPGAVSAAVAHPVSGFENDAEGVTAPSEYDPMILAVRCRRHKYQSGCSNTHGCKWVNGGCVAGRVDVEDFGFDEVFDEDFDENFDEEEFDAEDDPIILRVRCENRSPKSCRRTPECRFTEDLLGFCEPRRVVRCQHRNRASCRNTRGCKWRGQRFLGWCFRRRVVVKDLGFDGDEDEEFDFFDEE